MSAEFKVDELLKAQQWERCKGELRALVRMQGTYHTGCDPSAPEFQRWQRLKERVEAFIKDVWKEMS